jgi:hypothetical protein
MVVLGLASRRIYLITKPDAKDYFALSSPPLCDSIPRGLETAREDFDSILSQAGAALLLFITAINVLGKV